MKQLKEELNRFTDSAIVMVGTDDSTSLLTTDLIAAYRNPDTDQIYLDNLSVPPEDQAIIEDVVIIWSEDV